ncbi:hypothetical protein K443DRAFT_3107 [Laccaria amethystina LaAM-08-1]|uniref:Uncharacterized protein n=1 Tax=Laccaria amethystina LaAM-08-1 TaxID=1095629 RepID=A0A0C9X2G4_9AGAR|nr:hypothetical protein K443DRAFT_3107 [Laccaria amethystina LaAM-08-1]
MSHGIAPTWSSPCSGWRTRAEKYPNSQSYIPHRGDLKLAVVRNAPADSEGFTLALFSNPVGKERVAVDASGGVFVLAAHDFDGILGLAQRTLSLPKPNNFQATWVVKHERTSQPIDRILVAHVDLPSQPLEDYREEYTETSVQGFDKRKRELERAVDKIFELPLELWELTGVVLEARASGGEDDEGVLKRVRNVLGNVF